MKEKVVVKAGKKEKQHAGHAEIHGETIAKFEFFEQGFNPYSRYLDVDKVDLILRKKDGKKPVYHEVQVKYGRLHECKPGPWQSKLFDVTSWRFFNPAEFKNCPDTLFAAYVLVPPGGYYRGDIFVFPVRKFEKLIESAIRCNSKKGPRMTVCFSRSIQDKDQWYLRCLSKFDKIGDESTIDVSPFRRNFSFQS